MSIYLGKDINNIPIAHITSGDENRFEGE